MNKILMREELSHIFEKSGLDDISGIIDKVKTALSECSFESNPNYIICGRREFLIEESIGIINGDKKYCEDNLLNSIEDRARFVIGNIYELTFGNSYPYLHMKETRKTVEGSEIAKLRDMDTIYSQKGIVSLEEKNVIEKLIIKLEELYKNINR